MRLDLFLKTARLVKRRTVAQALCENGGVLVNGREAKPAKEVRSGDRITLNFSSRSIELEIIDARDRPSGGNVPPDERYRITAEKRIPREQDQWNEDRR